MLSQAAGHRPQVTDHIQQANQCGVSRCWDTVPRRIARWHPGDSGLHYTACSPMHHCSGTVPAHTASLVDWCVACPSLWCQCQHPAAHRTTRYRAHSQTAVWNLPPHHRITASQVHRCDASLRPYRHGASVQHSYRTTRCHADCSATESPTAVMSKFASKITDRPG